MGCSVANAGPHVMVMTVRRNTFRSCRRTVTFFVFKSVITRRKGGRASEGGFIVAYTRLRGRKLDGSVRKRSALVCENVIRRLKRGMNVGQVGGGAEDRRSKEIDVECRVRFDGVQRRCFWRGSDLKFIAEALWNDTYTETVKENNTSLKFRFEHKSRSRHRTGYLFPKAHAHRTLYGFK